MQCTRHQHLKKQKVPVSDSTDAPFIKILTRLSACIKFLCEFFRLCLLPKPTQLVNELADYAVILKQ